MWDSLLSVSHATIGDLVDLLEVFSRGDPFVTQYPITFEDMKQVFGFVWYRTSLPSDIPILTPLSSQVNGVHDRAYISVGGVISRHCVIISYKSIYRSMLQNILSEITDHFISVLVPTLLDARELLGKLTICFEVSTTTVMAEILPSPMPSAFPSAQ
ncbi:hypothetical protein AB205_0121180 [Aquarana catesbeiana]|uniref:Beta-galactosidase 1-like first all-beta domain-containing protein n=1 Tax=Aquarana catesbeiana TaxID=8400 RepID=A0A2G9RLK4_AQUCT|nr:hypothetical protein AB205_0121180 [Aquarana catesbeiana]